MREMAKSELARLAEPIRLVVLEIRHRLGRFFIPRLRSGPGIRYPAVVNIPGVMKILQNDQIITVDGDEGRVYL